MTSFETRSSEELRHAALAALGAHADERAVEALRHAVLAVEYGVVQWQSSTGSMCAHRVLMGVEARCLAGLRAAPATIDALAAAFAAAIAERSGETLLELLFRWMPGASVLRGYRDAPREPVSLRDGLAEYLDALGERTMAGVIAAARVAPEYPSQVNAPSRISVELDPADRATLKGDSRALATLADAIRDLLGDARTRLEVT